MTKEKTVIKERTRRAYNKVGEKYDSWYWCHKSKVLRKGLKDEVSNVVKSYLKGSKKAKILDVCCGTGYLYEFLKPYGEYTGVDFSESMVKTSKERYPKGEFCLGDAESLEFKDKTFDVVVCFWSFHHLTDPEKAISEFRRVLKPGGLLVIATFRKTWNILARIADYTTHKYYGFETFRYSENDLQGMLKEFKEIKISSFPSSTPLAWIGIKFLVVNAKK
jgi:ubiquinone/menaquinone biosynthesis C-methylase UbiE